MLKILWVGGESSEYACATPVASNLHRTADLRLWRSILATVKETTILQHPLFNLSAPTVPFRPWMKRSQSSWWDSERARKPRQLVFHALNSVARKKWHCPDTFHHILPLAHALMQVLYVMKLRWPDKIGRDNHQVAFQSRQVASNGWCRVLKCGHFRRTSYTSIFYQWCFFPK